MLKNRFSLKHIFGFLCCGFIMVNLLVGYYTVSTGYVSPEIGRIAIYFYYTFEGWLGLTFSLNIPTYTEQEKKKIYQHTKGIYWDNHTGCQPIQDSFMLFAMRTPKAASTTLEELVSKLSSRNKFVVNHVTFLTMDKPEVNTPASQTERVEHLCNYFNSMSKRVVHVAHLRYLDFEEFNLPQPIYVGTVRDPVLRMQSSYNYDFFADRPLHIEHADDKNKSKIKNHKTPTFVDCIRAHMKGNAPSHYACLRPVYGNTQLRYYCGMNQLGCRTTLGQPDSKLQWAYEMALKNMANSFRVVMVVERMKESIELLEKVLPMYFRGAMKIYNSSADGMHSNVNTRLPPPGTAKKSSLRSGDPSSKSAPPSNSSGSGSSSRSGSSKGGDSIPLVRGIPKDVRDFLENGALRYEMKLYAAAERHLDHNLQQCHMG